jgi:hypothetical protein
MVRHELTDKNPLSGFEMYSLGAITADQIKTVNAGETMDTHLDTIASDGGTTKLISMPLPAGCLADGAHNMMMEVSNESQEGQKGDEYTLKAYSTGTVIKDGRTLMLTYIIPLGAEGKFGLAASDLGKQMTIQVGGQEIKITLDALDAKTGAAHVVVSRS